MSLIRPNSVWLRPKLVTSGWEIAAVLFIWGGYLAYVSTHNALHGSSNYYINYFNTDATLLYNTSWSSATLALMLAFLHYRKWTSADFKIRPAWWSSVQGIFLLIATKVGYAVASFSILLLAFFFQDYARSHVFIGAHGSDVKSHVGGPNWSVLIIFNIINAYSEELPIMGYAFNQFSAKQGPLFALVLTVLLRMSYHTYQGLFHVLELGVVFTLLELCYWRTRNLWPVILAHIGFDIFPMDFLTWTLNFVSYLLKH